MAAKPPQKLSRFNSQPPEGGWTDEMRRVERNQAVSTHSRPKAAGRKKVIGEDKVHRFNSQPPEGGWLEMIAHKIARILFQLTAARRRLDGRRAGLSREDKVSTHSRPKAAGILGVVGAHEPTCFNSQPPEGGWGSPAQIDSVSSWFQLTAARRRLGGRRE